MNIRTVLAAAVTVAAVALGAAANATTFYFRFDNGGGSEPDGTIGSPLAGSGTFTTSAVLTPGLYDLTSLPDYSMAFSFDDGNSYLTGYISTPLDGVALDVTTFGSGLRMVWTEVPGSPDADGGSDNGSLDLGPVETGLSFEPTYAGGNNLYYEGPSYFGNYLATTGGVPEPSAWALMLVGLGGLGAAMRSRRGKFTAGA
jgi:hypothetical protein